MVQKIDNVHLEIVLMLLKGKVHLREMARLLGESHSTVLRKINGLIERNIVESESQGKNKLYSLKSNIVAKSFVYMAEEYKLIKLLEKYPKLGVILEDVIEKADAKVVVVFGSYAKFSAKPDSDIDLFIETKDKKIKEIVRNVNSKLSVKIGPFDKDSLLIKEIIKDHVIVKGAGEFYNKIKRF